MSTIVSFVFCLLKNLREKKKIFKIIMSNLCAITCQRGPQEMERNPFRQKISVLIETLSKQ